MSTSKAGILADSPADRGESVAAMEPMVLSSESRDWANFTDLALDVAARSAALNNGLPRGIRAGLADLARAMNCYYSNLIEGHETHPVDIERALRDDFSADHAKRNLQLEAKAHIEVQRWIDAGGVWSIARGFGRNIAAYKGHLSACDLPRRNDLDGRGNLSEEELVKFTRFFLETCIDQVGFMQALVQPDRLRARILLWAQEE